MHAAFHHRVILDNCDLRMTRAKSTSSRKVKVKVKPMKSTNEIEEENEMLRGYLRWDGVNGVRVQCSQLIDSIDLEALTIGIRLDLKTMDRDPVV